jgi:hypothetical protein
MLGKIINARCADLRFLTAQARFGTCAYANEKDRAEPGDIVVRESQPRKYFYVDRISQEEGRAICVLISLEKLSKVPDRIIAPYPHGLSELKPVDHIPQVSEDERSALMRGIAFGTRESLITKWRSA